MNIPNLTLLESEVIKWLLDGDNPVLDSLRRQLSSIESVTRELTGHGFYLIFNYAVRPQSIDSYLPVKANFSFGDVEASIDSVKGGAGFLLWIENGVLSELEGYTYGEEWPFQVEKFTLQYLYEGKRDLYELSRNWST